MVRAVHRQAAAAHRAGLEARRAGAELPWSLDRMGKTADEMAAQVVAFRLRASAWHVEAKLSQDKPADERRRLLAGLESPGSYANRPLADAFRRHSGRRAG